MPRAAREPLPPVGRAAYNDGNPGPRALPGSGRSLVRVSLKDVALHAGVSVKTVSNVVNDFPHVTEAMRARVQRSIDELATDRT